MQTDLAVGPAGDVWFMNNLQDVDSCFGVPDELLSTRCGGQGVTSNGSKKRLAARIAPHTLTHATGPSIMNRFLEPAFFNAGEVDNEIERLSGKFDEPTTQRIGTPRGVAAADGLIATWGRVTLESLYSTAINEWAAGRSPHKGILIDFIGNFSNSARWGLPIYRVSGGPGGRQALIPKGAGPCVSSQLIRGLCCQARTKRVLHRRLIPRIRKTTVIDLRQIPLTKESRRLSPGSHTTF
jgi:hypothetical protein